MSRRLRVRFDWHIRYIRTNSPNLAYVMHILNNEHECGPANYTIELPQSCDKDVRVNGWEICYIQEYQARGQLLEEQSTQDFNALYRLA